MGVKDLLAAFPGSTVTLTMHPLNNPTGIELARRRGLVSRQIKNCRNCDLCASMPTTPVPFTGPSTWGILGEGPGNTEARQVKPFVGPSGKLLKGMMRKVGLDASQAQMFNVVSCFPKTGEGKGVKARQPTIDEAKACRMNLVSQLQLLSEPFILLVGGTALRSVRPDLKVTDTHGRLFVWHVEDYSTSQETPSLIGSFYVMPIYHPASLLRQDNLKSTTMKDLQEWARLILGEVQPVFDHHCLNCGLSNVDNMDPDGISYCDKHYGRYGGNWLKAREIWRQEKEDQANAQSSFF